LASFAFLVTFTIRSWHEGIWRPGQAADYGIGSAIQHSATARGTSIAAPPLEAAPPLATVLRQEAARLRAAPMPAVPSAVAASASDYLAEREREAGHSGRMR
jgi:hypothetical protein